MRELVGNWEKPWKDDTKSPSKKRWWVDWLYVVWINCIWYLDVQTLIKFGHLAVLTDSPLLYWMEIDRHLKNQIIVGLSSLDRIWIWGYKSNISKYKDIDFVSLKLN